MPEDGKKTGRFDELRIDEERRSADRRGRDGLIDGEETGRSRIKQKRVVADSPGFEPGTEAPEAPVLSRLYYESS